jgi:hypothetical protein
VLSVGAIAVFGISSVVVLLHAYFTGNDIPAWAAATQSAVITAALALIFRDKLSEK